MIIKNKIKLIAFIIVIIIAILAIFLFKINAQIRTSNSTVFGRLTDTYGDPVVGSVSFVNKTNKYGTRSSESGDYFIKNIPNGGYTVSITDSNGKKYKSYNREILIVNISKDYTEITLDDLVTRTNL